MSSLIVFCSMCGHQIRVMREIQQVTCPKCRCIIKIELKKS